MITFAREPFPALAGEIMPLWEAHWREIGQDRERVPLDPDWTKYERLDALGMLEITAARRDGALVGYVFSFVDAHLHYRSTLFAHFDLYYLRPGCRGGRSALRLFSAHEAQLRARGVAKVFGNTKLTPGNDHGRLFTAMGWREAERLYAKVL